MFLFGSRAEAWVLPLDPQNRIHAGLSMTDSSLHPGGIMGLDSRMTRLIYVDVGGFVSLDSAPEVELASIENDSEFINLRHGITVTPGVRIPHRYSEGINWDFTFRAGFAAVWSSDASSSGVLQVDPALIGGVDFLLRRDAVGLRLGARMFGLKPYVNHTGTDAVVLRPQTSVEFVYQW